MATHSSTLAWQIPWTEEPGRLQSMGSLGVRQATSFHFSLSCIGEGNGNPLQCSCLEDPRDGGAWWAAIYGVPQSRTRLKQLSSSSSMYTLVEIRQWIFSGEELFIVVGKYMRAQSTYLEGRKEKKKKNVCDSGNKPPVT